jgi:hypothetical protein
LKTAPFNPTPGPWSITGNDTIIGPAGNVVAECCGYSDKATDPAQRAQGGRESNARLIAAAPDLLAALQLAESSLSTYAKVGAFTPGQPSGWLLNQLSAAITKATGGGK